ncbi:MAG: FAD-dependent oxidoreductase [Pirellulaceae bacterium]|nr:FAD-dependent oxidoreductase [Pirellulaceae bacterium]
MSRKNKSLTRREALQSACLLGACSLGLSADVSVASEKRRTSSAVLSNLPVLFETDVLVVGGGAGGICAAVAAARAGAKTTLIERWPILGGLATMGRVNMWHTSDRKREVIFGLTREMVERLKSYDGIQQLQDFPNKHETYIFSPEWLAIVHDDLVREAKIRTLCYTQCVGAIIADRNIEAAVIATPTGLKQVRAKRFIDASGDGSLGFFAGCRTDVGRKSDGKTQGMSQLMSFEGLDRSHEKEIVEAIGPMRKRMAQLRDEGKLPAFGPHWFVGDFIWRWPGTLLACTSGDSLDGEDLTRAAMEARAKIPEFLRFFREEWPGCEKLDLNRLAPALGVRESRRVRGLYQFTGDDVRELRSFPDAVGQGFWMVDIHDPKGSGKTTWSDKGIHPEPGTTYQIPYRILVAADADNLLLAGRCASATHEGMAGLRVQTHCHVMGQAAGTAAALSLQADVRPADLEVADLQKRLIDAGVSIDLERVNKANNAAMKRKEDRLMSV